MPKKTETAPTVDELKKRHKAAVRNYNKAASAFAEACVIEQNAFAEAYAASKGGYLRIAPALPPSIPKMAEKQGDISATDAYWFRQPAFFGQKI